MTSAARDPVVARLIAQHQAYLRRSESDPRASFVEGLDVSGRSLREADLECGAFAECRFDRADLVAAYAHDVHLYRCSLVGARLASIAMAKAYITECDLRGVDFRGVWLMRTTFRDCDLRDADFEAAETRRTTFGQCDLRGARLRDIDLHRVVFHDTALAGADLTGAHGDLVRFPLNVGTPEEPCYLEGDAALEWLRAAGAEDVSWFVPFTPRPRPSPE
jgi:uncharacterized protein YjbI with pentapeptide repeats